MVGVSVARPGTQPAAGRLRLRGLSRHAEGPHGSSRTVGVSARNRGKGREKRRAVRASVRATCAQTRQQMTKPATFEHRTVAQKLPVSWRRIGDLNPGWDHSQTALAVRFAPCRERIRTLSKTWKRRSGVSGRSACGSSIRREGVPDGHAVATPRASVAVTLHRLPVRLGRPPPGALGRPLRQQQRRRPRGRPRRTDGR